MPRYSEHLIQEVLSSNDIVDYISQYVRLKPNGRDYIGLCPFHKEKSPSFHVNRDKQVFHCFGCNAGGGILQFVRRIEGLDFMDALKLLADRAGIILPEDGGVVDNEKYKLKQRVYDINRTTARFFYDTLTKRPEGRPGLEYLRGRKISDKTIVTYGLGFAPDGFDLLLGHLRSRGFKDSEMIEAGVVSSKNGKIFDRFSGRVMFPIIDLRGNVIGFGGRILKEGVAADGRKLAKYLNTSTTIVFDKGRNLFSLNLAKKTNEKRIILCEGYLDVISVYQAGIHNIVASLGTALTEHQAKLLLKSCSEILLCYDSDEAGQKATRRAIDAINAAGGKARVMQLPGTKDPDEYIKANGVEMFTEVMNSALPSSEFLIKNARRKFNLDTEEGKIGYVSDAVEALVGVRDSIEVDAYIKKISKESDISSDAIYAEYKKKAVTAAKQQQNQLLRVPQINVVSVGTSHNSKLENSQLRLLGLCTKDKKLYRRISAELSPEDYSTDTLKKLASRIYTEWEQGREPDFTFITDGLDAEEISAASKMFCIDDRFEDNERAVDELILTIRRESIEQMLMGETNPVKIQELIKQRDELGRK